MVQVCSVRRTCVSWAGLSVQFWTRVTFSLIGKVVTISCRGITTDLWTVDLTDLNVLDSKSCDMVKTVKFDVLSHFSVGTLTDSYHLQRDQAPPTHKYKTQHLVTSDKSRSDAWTVCKNTHFFDWSLVLCLTALWRALSYSHSAFCRFLMVFSRSETAGSVGITRPAASSAHNTTIR